MPASTTVLSALTSMPVTLNNHKQGVTPADFARFHRLAAAYDVLATNVDRKGRTFVSMVEGKQLPVYGTGENVRDWLYVDDHASALITVLTKGAVGESYNIGGNQERTNLQVVEAICDALDQRRPLEDGKSRRDLITFVTDRPGHDRRYAIDASKIARELGWTPQETFETGLAKTIDWYLDNEWWWGPIRSGKYGGERLGGRK